MSDRKDSHNLEDIAVRVMYFFNTMDTYLIASVLAYLLGWRFLADPRTPVSLRLFPAYQGGVVVMAVAVIVLYLLLRLADFHPLFVPFSLLGLGALILAGRLSPGLCLLHLLIFFCITSIVQIVLMGIPMGLAARSPLVPLRIYLNSFVIIAPTTISLPLTLYYQVFLAGAAGGLAARPGVGSLVFLAYIGAAVAVVRKYRKKGYVPGTHHPESRGALYQRAVVLNIDGLSQAAFDAGPAPFLKSLQARYASAAGGARTVYRALTNPAFASILSGVEPAAHGVTNNNYNQTIRTQALPDLIPTRLYGSMHVKHFSRPEWPVTVISLVETGYRNADRVMLDRLKEDMLRYGDEVKLWVTDLSEVDYSGHAWGSYSGRMSRALERIDGLIGEFCAWLEENNLLRDTLILVSSDHGLHIGEHSFLLHPREELVPLIFAGEGIRPVRIDGPVSIIDIAANISYGLGMPYCAGSRGRVFTEIFPAGIQLEAEAGC